MYSLRRLARQPVRTFAALAGVALAVGLVASVAVFVDGSAGQMTTRALAPVSIDLQVVLNRPLATDAPSLAALRQRIAQTPGVAAAAELASFDVGPGAVTAASVSLTGPSKVFAFDPTYLASFPLVRMVSGAFTPGSVLLSMEAADELHAKVGDRVSLALPGSPPALVQVGGMADFRAATTLFASRSADTQGEFSYVPNVVVVDQATFTSAVLPGLRADAASAAPVLRTPPVLEVQVRSDRARYANIDPAPALANAQGLRRTIERLAPGEVRVVDNVAGALQAAQGDAILAKIMFLFLGTPGVLLAANLARYATGLVAEADRREIALLRARGAGPAALQKQLGIEALSVGLIGALAGLAAATAVLTWLFGSPLPMGTPIAALASSAAVAIVAGLVTTAVALYVPRRLALGREISEERRELVWSGAAPLWMRLRLDLALIALAAAIEGITLLAGGFRPTAAEGQSLSLSFYTLLAPVFLWVGLTLLLVRLTQAVLRRADAGPRSSFGPLVRGLARRALARRSGPFGAGLIALALAVSFGSSLALFIATYDAHQRSDARIVVGGDLRVTPSAAARRPTTDVSWLMVRGVSDAASVTQIADALVGNDKRTLVAIDPSGFARVAQPPDAFFVGATATAAMDALRADPNAVLVSDELARTFNVLPGDTVAMRLPRSDGTLVPATFRAVGEFKNFPAFPQGIDVVANQAAVIALTARPADFFVLRTASPTQEAIDAVAATLRARPDGSSLLVQTVGEAYNADQSSLAALNLNGLGRIVTIFAVLMSAAAAAIFVAATLATRRKEYVTLRALGLAPADLRRLLVVEGALLVAVALLIGGIVGAITAALDIQILAPLFVVPPVLPEPAVGGLALLAVLVIAATAVALAAGAARISRLHPAEILREE